MAPSCSAWRHGAVVQPQPHALALLPGDPGGTGPQPLPTRDATQKTAPPSPHVDLTPGVPARATFAKENA